MEMSRAALRDICTQHKLYRTPHLNDKLYLNFKGFTHIACLEEYTSLRALFLEGNALQSLDGLPVLQELKCLYLQQNCLRSLDGLQQLSNLDTLNISSNCLASLQQLQSCLHLATLIAEHNHLSTVAALEPLLQCQELHTLDLQHNNIEDTAMLDAIITQLPQLRCLYLQGNPVVSKIPNYRKTVISRCTALTYLDDRPVTDEERLWCQAWAAGGIEAERTERNRQKDEVAAKQRRNFEWLQQLRREGFRKRRAMLGLPDGDTDPFFDTLPDQQQSKPARTGAKTEGDVVSDNEGSSNDAESDDDDDILVQEPPELIAARKRLAKHQANIETQGPASQQPGQAANLGDGTEALACDPLGASGSLEDGKAYFSSVKQAQQELDAAGGAAAVQPSPNGCCSSAGVAAGRLASLRAANQAALAAIGLSELPEAPASTAACMDVDVLSCTAADPEDAAAPALDNKHSVSPQQQDQKQEQSASGPREAQELQKQGSTESAQVGGLGLCEGRWSSAAADGLPEVEASVGSEPAAAAAAEGAPSSSPAAPVCAAPHNDATAAGSSAALEAADASKEEGGVTADEVVVEVMGDVGQSAAVPDFTTNSSYLYDLD